MCVCVCVCVCVRARAWVAGWVSARVCVRAYVCECVCACVTVSGWVGERGPEGRVAEREWGEGSCDVCKNSYLLCWESKCIKGSGAARLLTNCGLKQDRD